MADNQPDMLVQLEAIIADRRKNPKKSSYTNKMFKKGRKKMAQKVGEESAEVIIAALAERKEEQVNEIADLLYHLLVLMNDLDITLDDVCDILEQRHQPKSKS